MIKDKASTRAKHLPSLLELGRVRALTIARFVSGRLFFLIDIALLISISINNFLFKETTYICIINDEKAKHRASRT